MNAFRRWHVPALAALLAGLFLAFAASPSAVFAQATAPATRADDDEEEEEEEAEEKQVNPNDPNAPNPNLQKGFSVRKEDQRVIDAFEDFRRHSEKKAWELAFRAITSVFEKDPKGMVPAGGGLMLPTRQRVWAAMAALPPDGREAYRLFNDSSAKQLLDKATAAGAEGGDEIGLLRQIFQLYFVTSVGDEAADRLGDACFQAGDFLAADAAWKAILDHYPDTDLSKTRLRLKRCAALSRAGRWETFDQVAAEIGPENASETMRLGGREVPARQYLASLREARTTASSATAEPATAAAASNAANETVVLPRENKPLWQVQFMDKTLAERIESTLRNMGWGGQEMPISASVPPSATDGKRVYLNWLGIGFAVDAQTGKLLWRTRKFSELSNMAQQFVYGGINIGRYHLTLAGDRVYITGMPLDQLNQGMGAAYRMVCHNAETGAVVWSTKTGDGAPWSIASEPVVRDEAVYVAAQRTGQQEMHLLALSPDKGKLLWSVPLGTPQSGVDYRGQSQAVSPLLAGHGAAVYVVTNNGAVLAVNLADRRVDWAVTYEAPPVLSGYVMFIPSQVRRQPVRTPGAAFVRDSTLYFKESGGYAMYAVDLAGPALKWKRPVDPSDTLVSVGNGNAYLLGEAVSVIDLSTRALRWSTPIPTDTGMMRPLLGGDRVAVFGARGVFQIDLATGDHAGPPFRGADADAVGGALFYCGDRLVAVSNLTVTAYPVGPEKEQQSSVKDARE